MENLMGCDSCAYVLLRKVLIVWQTRHCKTCGLGALLIFGALAEPCPWPPSLTPQHLFVDWKCPLEIGALGKGPPTLRVTMRRSTLMQCHQAVLRMTTNLLPDESKPVVQLNRIVRKLRYPTPVPHQLYYDKFLFFVDNNTNNSYCFIAARKCTDHD